MLFKLSDGAKKLAKQLSINEWFKAPKEGDAGYDLRAYSFDCSEKEIVCVSTGVHVEIPKNYVGLIFLRSSFAVQGWAVLAGVVDSSYRGEIIVVLSKLGKGARLPSIGDRIAQIVVTPHWGVLSEKEELSETERNDGGFGSTGKV